MREFQSTLPRGERRRRPGCGPRAASFNPRSRAGSDYCFPVVVGFDWWFQSTLPRGERRGPSSSQALTPASFNPRSRAGSDFSRATKMTAKEVSIHAPARGATAALVGDAMYWFEFQSTLPRGERLRARRDPQTASVVSIHAPARGATRASLTCCGPIPQFQSTLPRGERLQPIVIPSPRIVFQSTLPRGERRRLAASPQCPERVSIHAPARGAT